MVRAALLVLLVLCAAGAAGAAGEPAPPPAPEARWYRKLDGGAVLCQLCPRGCTIPPGGRGYCTARKNEDGTLRSLVYGRPVTTAVDPIEKKPVFHLLPGSGSFSFATAGCNLRCIHCQNWAISQRPPEEVESVFLPPERIVAAARESGAASISYTYNEPTVFFEYMLDCARLARKEGLRNVWVTCGYIEPGPLAELCPFLDVARVDLKGFSEEFYGKLAGAKLEPVKKTLLVLKEKQVWTEVVNLVIPGMNDDPAMIRAMCTWLKGNLGPDVPLTFSRFHPDHKLRSVPATPVATLENARRIAQEAGLRFVYLGNVSGHDGESTWCPTCGKRLVRRVGYAVVENLLKDGACPACKQAIPGIWR